MIGAANTPAADWQPDPYYGRPEVSNSDLTKLKKELMGIQEWIDVEKAYKFGRLIDAIITEPKSVNKLMLLCQGEKYSKEDFEIAERMHKSFLADELCAGLLKQSDTQKIMIEQDKIFTYENMEFRLSVRCKWDLWMGFAKWGSDIKSTTATTQKQFEEAARHFDYDRQRSWYMDIAGSPRDMLIGISKINFKVFKIPIQRGDAFYTSGRNKYESLAFQHWDRYKKN